MTFRDHEPAGMVRHEVHPLSADLVPSQLIAAAHVNIHVGEFGHDEFTVDVG